MMENELKRMSEASNCIDENDYQKDGLWYCGKCNTPKQTKGICLGKEMKVFCLCECKTKERDEEERRRHEEETKRQIENMRRLGFADHEMSKWTFEANDRDDKTTDIAKNYVKKFKDFLKDGKGIAFFGKVGTGKTFISCCIANQLINEGYSCLVTNFARLVNQMSATYDRQALIDNLNSYQLLIIDDLAAERDTEYMNEIVYSIIDARYRAKMPLIVTTNLTFSELMNPSDISKQRIYSRITEMCIPVEVDGENRRKEKLRENMKYYQNLLGYRE